MVSWKQPALIHWVSMPGSLILLDGVWRTYPRGQVVALRGLTLSIERGDYLAITGPSGSGKSTLLYLAGGLDRPTQGRVLFDGVEPKVPARWTTLRARRIGFVFQAFHLMTVGRGRSRGKARGATIAAAAITKRRRPMRFRPAADFIDTHDDMAQWAGQVR